MFPPIEQQFENRYVVLDDQTKPRLEKELSGTIIETSGHTECSISLLLSNGVVFCGDAAMNGLPSLHRATIWIENLNDFSHSWETIIKLQPKVIYPGHGKPFKTSDLKRFLPGCKKLKSYPLTHIK